MSVENVEVVRQLSENWERGDWVTTEGAAHCRKQWSLPMT